MEPDEQGGQPRHVRSEIVRGEPYQVGDRMFVPEARVVAWGKAGARIGSRGGGGWGGSFAQIRPLAFIEITPDGERAVPVTDETGRALRQLAGAALVLLLLFTIVRWVAGRGCRACCQDSAQCTPADGETALPVA